MTPEERRREILAQPSAMKEVYAPRDHYVNGHIIVRGPDSWHLLYDPVIPGHAPNSYDHATSDDLVTWTHHGTVLEAGAPGDCDAFELVDGDIIEHEGRWYLIYTSRPAPGGSRWFALAVSDDLWHSEKYPGDGSPIFIPDQKLSGWREKGMMECKDPSIIRHDDLFYMYYICQRLVEPVDDPEKQTHTGINLATSIDLIHWEDHG